jgi:putative nucleotidyltransferase with HDIG domain
MGALVASVAMPEPTSTLSVIVWWAVFASAIAIPMVLTTRAVQHFLPLAALLELTLVFPDEAPSRFAVAKAAGRTRDLKKRLAETPSDGEPNQAAGLVLALITSLGDHDRLTRGHSERVRAFTDMLAEQIGVPQAEREKLRWAALLHDIGKLQVATEILNKQGFPDEDEWVILRQHPLTGTRLLGPLRDWLGVWIGAVRHHHEHWDGTGYSLGLKGEEISLGGRILAIADSYEVMTAARPYKKPLAPEAARQELARCAGTHFDPGLVRSFLELSIGRLWWTVGAASLVAQLPILGGLSFRGITQRLGRSAATVAGAALAVGGLVLSGAVDTASFSRPALLASAAGSESGSESGDQESAGAAAGPGSEGQQDDASSASQAPQPDNNPKGDTRADGSAAPESQTDPSADPAQGTSDHSTSTHAGGGGGSDNGSDGSPKKPHPYVDQGRIALAGPLNPNATGATESDFVASCRVPDSQGVDAWVFELGGDPGLEGPARVAGRSGVGAAALGGRAYDANCRALRRYDMGAEWALPPATRFIVVVAPEGVDTRVTLRIAS